MLTPADVATIRRMRTIGMLMPVRTLQAARAAGLPLALACSILTQETGGGRNLWGHDATIFAGGHDALHGKHWGETVTRAAYRAYLAQRGPSGRGGMQGVGPCQLTYYAFQDEADRLGGCWRPGVNMRVGFNDLAHLIRRSGLHAGVAAYNGTGPAATAYANKVASRAAQYAAILRTPWPPA